ncbi:MAG: hypothetical protein ACI8V8_001785 [Chitinophagales bacterium]|jgi:uncharacterized protein (TIGR02145 family)
MTKSIGSLVLFFLFNLYALNAQTFTCGDTLIDIDGNMYPTLELAGKCWMQENLKAIRCNDGTPISLTTDSILWAGLSSPSYTYYESDSNNVSAYGLLYNGYATMGPCEICPSGWSIPSDSAWTDMVNTLGGETTAGGTLKDTTGWITNMGSTNSSGFTAKPGGFRVANGGYDYLTRQARFWSSTMATAQNAWSRVLYFNNSTVGRLNYHLKNGMSVRCVRSLTTGIEESEQLQGFHVFPNPANNHVTIDLGSSSEINIIIASSLGEIVYASTSSNTQLVEVDLKGLNTGFYIVRIEQAGFMNSKKLFVTK